jgi:hypothetical protein
MDKLTIKNIKPTDIEKKLEEIKKDFIKIIPQLSDIQEAQKAYRDLQQKRVEEQYPFINTQTSSTT